MCCNYCVSLLLIFAPLFNFPFLALLKGPQGLVVKQYLFCHNSSEGFGFVICGGSVCVCWKGEMPSRQSVRGTVCPWMWALTSRRRGGEVEALELSISGIVNRACVWQGVLCEPRAWHGNHLKLGIKKEAFISPEMSNLPLGGWKGSDCKARDTELPSLQVARPAAWTKCMHQQPFGAHGAEILLWQIKQSFSQQTIQTTCDPLPRGAFPLQLAGSQLAAVLLWWRAHEHP